MSLTSRFSISFFVRVAIASSHFSSPVQCFFASFPSLDANGVVAMNRERMGTQHGVYFTVALVNVEL